MLLLCSVGKDVRRAQASVIGISFFLYGALKPQIQLCHTAPLHSVTDAGAPAETFPIEIKLVDSCTALREQQADCTSSALVRKGVIEVVGILWLQTSYTYSIFHWWSYLRCV